MLARNPAYLESIQETSRILSRFFSLRCRPTGPCVPIFTFRFMYIVAIAWLYVAILMSITETNVTAGVLTLVFYGLLPLGLLLWLVGTPVRRRRRLLDQTETVDQQVNSGNRENAQADQADLLNRGTELRATMQPGNQVRDRDVDHARAGKRE